MRLEELNIDYTDHPKSSERPEKPKEEEAADEFITLPMTSIEITEAYLRITKDSMRQGVHFPEDPVIENT